MSLYFHLAMKTTNISQCKEILNYDWLFNWEMFMFAFLFVVVHVCYICLNYYVYFFIVEVEW